MSESKRKDNYNDVVNTKVRNYDLLTLETLSAARQLSGCFQDCSTD